MNADMTNAHALAQRGRLAKQWIVHVLVIDDVHDHNESMPLRFVVVLYYLFNQVPGDSGGTFDGFVVVVLAVRGVDVSSASVAHVGSDLDSAQSHVLLVNVVKIFHGQSSHQRVVAEQQVLGTKVVDHPDRGLVDVEFFGSQKAQSEFGILHELGRQEQRRVVGTSLSQLVQLFVQQFKIALDALFGFLDKRRNPVDFFEIPRSRFQREAVQFFCNQPIGIRYLGFLATDFRLLDVLRIPRRRPAHPATAAGVGVGTEVDGSRRIPRAHVDAAIDHDGRIGLADRRTSEERSGAADITPSFVSRGAVRHRVCVCRRRRRWKDNEACCVGVGVSESTSMNPSVDQPLLDAAFQPLCLCSNWRVRCFGSFSLCLVYRKCVLTDNSTNVCAEKRLRQ
mmetsp:Transcript_20681/g.58900  ORF Transcript_20681/g.58900 Transcript_20681/m.58900 type:complete len:394 (-) Transcript_20681:222-1403(-)